MTLAHIGLFKFNNGNTRKSCETCPKVPLKIPEQSQWCRSGAFIVIC